MSESIWSSVFTLIGVVVGFSLSQVADYIKEANKKRTVKNALLNELLVIRDSLSEAVKKEHQLSKDKLPLVTEVYDTSKSKLANVLTIEQLNLIQKTYAHIKQTSLPMNSGKTLFRGYIELAGGDHVIYQHDLNEEVTLLNQAISELNKSWLYELRNVFKLH